MKHYASFKTGDSGSRAKSTTLSFSYGPTMAGETRDLPNCSGKIKSVNSVLACGTGW